jgi:peptidase M23-like protein
MPMTISARLQRWTRATAVATGATLVALSLGATTAASAQGAPERVGHRGAPSMDVVAAPSPVLATDMHRHLVYEIAIDNSTRSQVRLDELEVRDPAGHRVLSSYHDDAITGLMAGFRFPLTRTFAPGESDVLLLDVLLAADQRAPSRLEHRFVLTLDAEGPRPRRLAVTAATTKVDLRDPIRLSFPLRGSGLGVSGGCCSSNSGHRHGLLEHDGRFVVAQRYAIDVVRVADPLDIFAGDPARNDSYFVYGAQVIAAAPGRIVASRDGVLENTPPNPPSDIALDDLTGNFVTQNVGRGRFALYAHLQPGSVRVKPGQRVRRGQVLGLVGNSGNSTGPHLHFQVMDDPGGPSSLIANGVPYVFDRFELDARVTGLESDPPAPVRVPADPPRQRTGQYPLTGDIITGAR